MKKITVLMISLVLIFSIGQVASAKIDAGVHLAYSSVDPGDDCVGLAVGLSGSYFLNDRWSFNGLLDIGSHSDSDDSSVLSLTLGASARFHLYTYDGWNFSLQAGITNSFVSGKTYNSTTHNFDSLMRDSIGIGIGIYTTTYYSPQINTFIDAMLHIVSMNFGNSKSPEFKFIQSGEVNIGIRYTINPLINVSLSIYFNLQNSSEPGFRLSAGYSF